MTMFEIEQIGPVDLATVNFELCHGPDMTETTNECISTQTRHANKAPVVVTKRPVTSWGISRIIFRLCNARL